MISSEMIDIMGPAIVAGLMVALTHAPLGIEVLKRGIIFIDLAVAQIAGCGLVVANVFWHDAPPWLMQAMALSFALLAGLFFRAIEKSRPAELEAVIGCSFVLAASVALLLLADHPHGGEEVQHLLSGQILLTSWQQVFQHAPFYVLILSLWFLKPSLRQGLGFYGLFALAITSSVQLVGVYVVFSSLILPALAATTAKKPLLMAYGCGICSVLMGMMIAMFFDLPAGSVLVITYTALTTLMMILPLNRKTN
ncbi:MAG: metal ABC transporter permease [Alphaproteobacteria bacterium]